jgi:uncharacterized membrane protein
MSVRNLLSSRDGNVAIMAAVFAPLTLATLALAIDYGDLTLQQRQLQQTADLAAIAGASNIKDPLTAVSNYLSDNGYKLDVSYADASTASTLPVDKVKIMRAAGSTTNGYALVTKGKYTADASMTAPDRFKDAASGPNAIGVTLYQTGSLNFAGSFADPPVLHARGTAAQTNVATFSVGSRLASVNGGVLNATLSALVGSSVSLNVMDYDALASADLDLFQFSQALATELKLSGVTYSQALTQSITWPRLIDVLITCVTSNKAKSALKALRGDANSKLTATPSLTLALGRLGNQTIGAAVTVSQQPTASAELFDVVNAMLAAANAAKQIEFNLDGMVAGLTSVKVHLAIGERPLSSPSIAVDEAGSIVRTAQTRLSLELATPGLTSLAGTSIRVPIYIEAAYAEAKLSAIYCSGRSRSDGSVEITSYPGIAEVSLGDVDASALDNFSKTPRVSRTTLVKSLLINATGYAHVESTNIQPRTLSFSADDIARGTVKNISTKNITESLLSSLLGSTDLQVTALGITVGTPAALMSALQQTLASVAAPIDELLWNLTSVLGVKIGEADIRATDISCRNAALVQ